MTDHNEPDHFPDARKMVDLAARIERAEGPDRALDAEIHALLNPDARWVIGHEDGRFPQEAIYGSLWDAINVFADKRQAGDYINAPAYTASIDAAMQLVPEGWCFTVATYWCEGEDKPPYYADCGDLPAIKRGDDNAIIVEAFSTTPALALCAAAIRARSAS